MDLKKNIAYITQLNALFIQEGHDVAEGDFR